MSSHVSDPFSWKWEEWLLRKGGSLQNLEASIQNDSYLTHWPVTIRLLFPQLEAEATMDRRPRWGL